MSLFLKTSLFGDKFQRRIVYKNIQQQFVSIKTFNLIRIKDCTTQKELLFKKILVARFLLHGER